MNKKTLYILFSIVLFIIIILFIMLVATKKRENEKLKEFTIPNNSLLYITSNDCEICKDTDEIITKLAKKHNLKLKIFNKEKYPEKSYKGILKFAEITEDNTLPIIISIRGGMLKGSIYPIYSENSVTEFLIENQYIKNTKKDLLITSEMFDKLLNSSNNSLVVMGGEDKLESALNFVREESKKNNFNFLYSNIEYPDCRDSLNKVEKSLDRLVDKESLILSIGNKKITEYKGNSSEDLIKFVKDNNIK